MVRHQQESELYEADGKCEEADSTGVVRHSGMSDQ